MIASILLNTNTLVYLLGFVVSLSCFGCSDCFILQRQGLQRTTAPLFALNAPVSTDGSSNIANKEIINPIINPITDKAGITTSNRNPGKSLTLHWVIPIIKEIKDGKLNLCRKDGLVEFHSD